MTGKHREDATFRLWWMNSDHTFVRLRTESLDDTLAHVRDCWKHDPWGMLGGYYPKPDERHLPGSVHGHGRNKRKEFETEARKWLSRFLPEKLKWWQRLIQRFAWPKRLKKSRAV